MDVSVLPLLTKNFMDEVILGHLQQKQQRQNQLAINRRKTLR